MITTQLKRVRRLFNSAHATDAINRHNRLEWVKSVRRLGAKWVYAEPVKIVNQRAVPRQPVGWHGT